MSGSETKYLYSYEENEQLSSRIQEIMTEKTSDIIKIKNLKMLQSTASSQLCKSHVEYLLNQLESKIRTRICRVICWVILAPFTLIMLLVDIISIISIIFK